MVKARKELLAFILVIAAIIMWSSAFIVTRWLVGQVEPTHLLFLRQFVMVCAALLFLFLARKPVPSLPYWPKFLLNGLLSMVLYFYFFNKSLLTLDAASSSFIISQAPILGLIFAFFLLKESVIPRHYIGIFGGFAGTLLIFIAHAGEVKFNIGLLYALAALVVTTLGFVLQKRFFVGFSGFYTMSLIAIAGMIPLLFLIPDIVQILPVISRSQWVWIIYLGLVPSFLGYSCWAVGLSVLSANRAIIMLYAIPLLVTLESIVILHEWPVPLAFIGGMIALMGAVVASYRSKNNKAGSEGK